MKLTRSRLDSLRAIHGHKMVASLSRSILLWLAETEAQIEKLRYGNPRWFAKRIAMLREFRLQWGPTPPPRSCQLPDVPETYRITKISHWYKDHLRRTEDMLSDAVCQESVGFKSSQSLDDTIVAFNAHIAPIAKLYRFQLQMALADDDIVLRGDAGKAYSVLLYLCRESRTPEIDWLLDTVMWFQISRIGRRPGTNSGTRSAGDGGASSATIRCEPNLKPPAFPNLRLRRSDPRSETTLRAR